MLTAADEMNILDICASEKQKHTQNKTTQYQSSLLAFWDKIKTHKMLKGMLIFK